jgi:hypothetical protein
MYALEEFPGSQAARHDRTRVASTDQPVYVAFGKQLPATEDGGIGLAAERVGRLFFHIDGHRSVDQLNPMSRIRASRRKQRFNLGLIADENN